MRRLLQVKGDVTCTLLLLLLLLLLLYIHQVNLPPPLTPPLTRTRP